MKKAKFIIKTKYNRRFAIKYGRLKSEKYDVNDDEICTKICIDVSTF